MLSEHFGNAENGFFPFPSRSERLKMDFYTFRVARKHRKWIFIHFERLGSTENEFLFIPSRSEASKMNFYSFRATRKLRKWIFMLSEWLGSSEKCVSLPANRNISTKWGIFTRSGKSENGAEKRILQFTPLNHRAITIFNPSPFPFGIFLSERKRNNTDNTSKKVVW